MSSHKEVHYVVSRLKDPGNVESAREPIDWHPSLHLAKKHADRVGAGTCVDAEGGSYHLSGPYRGGGQWQAEWTNRNLYQGGKKRSAPPSIQD